MCSFWFLAALGSCASQIPSVSYWLMYHPYTSHSCSNSYRQYSQTIQIYSISMSNGPYQIFLWTFELSYETFFCSNKYVHFPYFDFIHWMDPLEEYGYNVCRNFNLNLFVGWGIPISFEEKEVFYFSGPSLRRCKNAFLQSVWPNKYPQMSLFSLLIFQLINC